MGESIVKEIERDYNLSEEQVYDLLNEYINYRLGDDSVVTKERRLLYKDIRKICLRWYF